MNMKFFTLAVVGFAAMSVFAESEDSMGRWSFSAGPAWRNQIKLSVKGQNAVQPSENRDMTQAENWDNASIETHPEAGTGMIPEGAPIWTIEETRYEIVGTGDSIDNNKNSMGANFQLGYDFYQSETLSIGLNARFAGYWNMKSANRSIGSALQTWNDYYIFENTVPVQTIAPEQEDGITKHHEELISTTEFDGGLGAARIRGDLYQLGLGPKVAWTPFAGCESCSLDWLTIYGGVEALCNISHAKLEGAASGSSTDCLLGFGGNVGLVGNITENVGIYGQVGYEWIDSTDVSTGGFKADVDYSSLVFSAGIQVRF